MADEPKTTSTEYLRINAMKSEMSQIFDDTSKVVPCTQIIIKNGEDIKILEEQGIGTKIKIVGKSKGKGFAGTVKKWGFRGGPRSHGQTKHRAPGSIGTQGQGRVLPGKKMAGRMGGQKITTQTRLLKVDTDTLSVQVKGGIPGHRNAPVVILIKNNNS